MISKVDVLVNSQKTELKLDNRVYNITDTKTVEQLKKAAERYFSQYANEELKASYVLWTEAISIDELEKKKTVEADCLEVFIDQQLKDRNTVWGQELGKELFYALQEVCLDSQKNQLRTRRMYADKDVGVYDWKTQNTWLVKKGGLLSTQEKTKLCPHCHR